MNTCNWEGSWFARVREMGKVFPEVTKGDSWPLFLTIAFKARIIVFILQNRRLRTN